MSPSFVCTTADVNEAQVTEDGADGWSVREYVLSMWDIVEQSKSVMRWMHYGPRRGGVRSLEDFRALLMYGCEHPTRGKTRYPVDVTALVQAWVPIIRGLSTAHDKAPLDQCEFAMDEHLTPLLTAPVRQIREFYEQLVIALKADPTIPFFVWAWFESWGEVILKRAPDGEVKALKVELASQIADMVEKDVQPDLKAAIAGALQWRAPESLEKIKTAVEKGGKARMVGRESCLFLEVDVEGATERVML